MFTQEIALRAAEKSASRVERNDRIERREVERQVWKRDLSLRTNGTVDPWVIIHLISSTCVAFISYLQYGCFLLDMFIDYAINYTFPWSMYIAIFLQIHFNDPSVH